MRCRLWLTSLGLVLGCGGASSTVTPPPSPPAAGSISIQAGDGQQAAAGSVLPVKPAVIVKDAGGAPLAGVVVTFVVEAGGGSLASSTATTGSTGLAESGAWTIGAGTNRVHATAGTLTPVVFTATGTAVNTPVVLDATVGSSGGSFTMNRPGDPLNGMTLAVAAPGFGKSVQIEVRSTTASNTPSRSGVRIISPVLAIETNAVGPAKAGVQLKIPATLATGEWPVAWVFDPVSGASYSAMVAPSGPGMVTLLLPQIDQTGLDVAPVSGLRALFMSHVIPGSTVINIVVGAAPVSELAKDLNTGYLPASDDWEFDYALATVATDSRFAPGLALTASWYFDHFKGSRGALNRKYQQASGIEWSNPKGIAMTALTTAEFGANLLAAENYYNAIAELAANSGLPVDSLQLLAIKSGIYLTGRPQPIYATTEVGNEIQTSGVTLLAYRTHGSTLDVSAGTSATGVNGPKSVTLTAGKFPSITWGYKSPISLTIDQPSTFTTFVYLGPTAGISAAKLNSLWQQVFDGSILDGLGKFQLITHESRTGKDTLFVPGDTTRVWWEGPCPFGFPAGPAVVGQAQGNIAGVSYFERIGNNWGPAGKPLTDVFGITGYGKGVKADTSHNGNYYGGVVVCAGPDGAIGKGSYSGWVEFAVKNRKVTIADDPLNGVWGTKYTLTASSEYAAPSQASWVWTLGDGRTMTTSTNTLDVTWTRPSNLTTANYNVHVSLKSGGVPFAGGNSVAKLQPKRRAWRLTAFVKSGDLPLNPIVTGDYLAEWNLFAAQLTQLESSPSDGLLFQEDSVTIFEHAMYLQFAPAGTGGTLTYNNGSPFTEVARTLPAGQCSYCAYAETGDLPTGGIISGVAGLQQPGFTIQSTHQLLQVVNTINATKVGNQLMGTMTFKTADIGGKTYNFIATYVGTPP